MQHLLLKKAKMGIDTMGSSTFVGEEFKARFEVDLENQYADTEQHFSCNNKATTKKPGDAYKSDRTSTTSSNRYDIL